MNIEIRPLTPELKEDYLHLFDNMIHKENPEWSKCYCNDYHFLGDVETCTRSKSREMIIDRINVNELQGYLVFDGETPIGWCNVNNRSNYQRLLRDYDLVKNPNEKVCAIVCFLIRPEYRRKGITQRMLDKVTVDYRQLGYDYIESYPKKGEANTSSFNGSMELYKRNEFKIFEEHDKYMVMRKKLS